MKNRKNMVVYPVRDRMWVENECSRKNGRAVRYAIFKARHVPTGLSERPGIAFFYPHCVPNGTLTSSTETIISHS